MAPHRKEFEDTHLSLEQKLRFWNYKMKGWKDGRPYEGTIMQLADSTKAAPHIYESYHKFVQRLAINEAAQWRQ